VRQGTRRPVEQKCFGGLFLLLAGLSLAAAVWTVWDETETRRPWKSIRSQFNAVAARLGQPLVPIEIEQVTNPDLGIVDRCQTCHPAIDQAGFESEELPLQFRTHPRRKELLGKNHPVESFGCTICHHGQGPQTKGVGSLPFDHGRKDPYWERPLLTGKLVQSTCVQCHDQEFEIPGAEAFNKGRRIFEDRRCFGCHSTKVFKAEYEAGPDLSQTREKHSPYFLEAWIRNPGEFRPDTRMPQFWPNPVEPASGEPSPVGSERHQDWQKLKEQEPRAIAAFLGSVPAPEPLVGREPVGSNREENVNAGKLLFDTIGCRGCHRLGSVASDGEAAFPEARDGEAAFPEARDGETAFPEARDGETAFPEAGDGKMAFPEADFGPQLDRQGEKSTATWLAAWLANPGKLRPATRMPDLRLTTKEVDQLTAYLVSVRKEGEPVASGRGWSTDKALIEEGRQAVLKYGCYGCHTIAGFEKAGRAGPQLDDFGSKAPDSLEWGNAPAPADVPTYLGRWTSNKLISPRRMGRAGIELFMPHDNLSAEEVEALSVLVLSDQEGFAPDGFRRKLDARTRALHEGERLVRQFNCRGCHEIGRDEIEERDEDGELLDILYVPHGGELRRLYDDPAMAPPSLTFAGEKFQYPWLYEFLGKPTTVRTWLAAKMPTFKLKPGQAESIIEYLALRNEQEYPFESLEVADIDEAHRDDAIWLFDKLQCLKCHQVSTMKALAPAERAPDLAISWKRLKPGWQRRWLLVPHIIQPGTKMPTLFPLEDDDVPDSYTTPYPELLGGTVDGQIDALVALTMLFGQDYNLSLTLDKLNEARGDKK